MIITADDFNKKLKQFYTQPSAVIQDLDSLVEQYPYFQLARVLQLNRTLSDAEMACLAFLYGDREFLYRLMQAGQAGKSEKEGGNGEAFAKEECGTGETAEQEHELSLDELVQKFTANPPKISKITEDFSDEEPYEDLGKSSSVERLNIVSETLAEIYVNQKAYDRAIKIYKVLMEKHPEKSATFANAIENIKSLKN